MEHWTEYPPSPAERAPKWLSVVLAEHEDEPNSGEVDDRERPLELPLGFV
jgi:hypothetical protein